MKLVMDLPARAALRVAMDADRRERIASLCTEIGALMEDVSVVALECRGDETTIRQRVDDLAAAIAKMHDLVTTARALASPAG